MSLPGCHGFLATNQLTHLFDSVTPSSTLASASSECQLLTPSCPPPSLYFTTFEFHLQGLSPTAPLSQGFSDLDSHEGKFNWSRSTFLLQPHQRSLNGLTTFWSRDQNPISGYLESCDMTYSHPGLWMGGPPGGVQMCEMPCIPQPPWSFTEVPQYQKSWGSLSCLTLNSWCQGCVSAIQGSSQSKESSPDFYDGKCVIPYNRIMWWTFIHYHPT